MSTKKKELLKELEEQIKGLTDEQVILVAQGRFGFAVFPDAKKGASIQGDRYFAKHYPGRVTITLPCGDCRWPDLPENWLDIVTDEINNAKSIGNSHKSLILEFLAAGVVQKVKEMRQQMLSRDLMGALDDALTEASERHSLAA